MGCACPKPTRVSPGSLGDHNNALEQNRGTQLTIEEYELDKNGNKVITTSFTKKQTRSSKVGREESTDDVRSTASERAISASSKQSSDSGLGKEPPHVVVERSDEDKVREVEGDLIPPEDQSLGERNVAEGVMAGSGESVVRVCRQEEAHIMQSLREEGLISRSQARSGGVCFEIVAASGDGLPKPPPRLEKLVLERNSAKKGELTEDQIRHKLERAERRRKRREQERLEKLKELERGDWTAAQQQIARSQRSLEESLSQRLDTASHNKQRKIRQLRDRLQHSREHAEMVRRRKALTSSTEPPIDPPDPPAPPSDYDAPLEPRGPPTEKDSARAIGKDSAQTETDQ